MAVPFPAVRHVTCWLDRPQPAPGWGRFSEQGDHLVWRRGATLLVPPEAEKGRSQVASVRTASPERCGRGRRGFKSERQQGKIRTDTAREWNSRRRASVCSPWAIEEESNMPVLLLWAVPAVIVVGGVGYYLVRVVH